MINFLLNLFDILLKSVALHFFSLLIKFILNYMLLIFPDCNLLTYVLYL